VTTFCGHIYSKQNQYSKRTPKIVSGDVLEMLTNVVPVRDPLAAGHSPEVFRLNKTNTDPSLSVIYIDSIAWALRPASSDFMAADVEP